MKDILLYTLFRIGDQDITVGQLALAIALVFLMFGLYRVALRRFFPRVFKTTEISERERFKLNKFLRGLALIFFLLCLVLILQLDFAIYEKDAVRVSVLTFIKAAMFFQVLRLIHWLLSNLFIHNYYCLLYTSPSPRDRG